VADDFGDAHKRHWEDAEILFTKSRWANADHLYGISAECGLKALIVAFNGTQHKLHLNQNKNNTTLVQEYQSAWSAYLVGRPEAYKISTLPPDFFKGWSVDQRYHSQSLFNEQTTEKRKSNAGHVYEMVKAARSEGFI